MRIHAPALELIVKVLPHRSAEQHDAEDAPRRGGEDEEEERVAETSDAGCGEDAQVLDQDGGFYGGGGGLVEDALGVDELRGREGVVRWVGGGWDGERTCLHHSGEQFMFFSWTVDVDPELCLTPSVFFPGPG